MKKGRDTLEEELSRREELGEAGLWIFSLVCSSTTSSYLAL